MTTADDVFDAVMGYAAKEYQRGYESGKRDAAHGENQPERTCVDVGGSYDGNYVQMSVDGFGCSICGWDGIVDDGNVEKTKVNYCPRCGTKVVSIDDVL